jgi:hypothetical protein
MMIDSDELYAKLSEDRKKKIEAKTKKILRGKETITVEELAKKLGWSVEYVRKIINFDSPPKRPEYYLVRLDGPIIIRMDEENNPETFAHYEVAEYIRQQHLKTHPEENWTIRDTNEYPLAVINDRWKSIKNQ